MTRRESRELRLTGGRSGWRLALASVALVLALGMGTLGALVAAVRVARGNPASLDRIRAFNRRSLNPRMMRLAGSPRIFADVLWHRGRRSGRLYATPVEAFPVDDGFAIPLTYGLRCDWALNTLAAGEAILECAGARYHLSDPRVVAIADLRSKLPPAPRVALRLLGIREALWLRVDASHGREKPV